MTFGVDETQSYQKLKAVTGSIRGFPTAKGWTIGRVVIAEPVQYLYNLWSELAITGAAGSGIVPILLQDSSSHTIPYHENEDELWEIFAGWSNPYDYVFFQYNGNTYGRLQKDIGDWTLSTTAASSFGWLLQGWESPIYQETGRGRFLLPAYQNIKYGLFNPWGKAHTPTTNLVMNKLSYEAFDPEDKRDLRLMIDVLKGRIREGVWLYSPGVDALPLRTKSIKDLFGVKPLEWDGNVASVEGKVMEVD